jgi:hypothetical protein
VSHKEKIVEPARPEPWTRPDDYLGAMARKRSFRRAREPKSRTEPERPRLLLSTAPFLALLILLGVLAVAIMIVAFPGSQPQIREPAPPANEQGVAQRGWFQKAEREFHRQN